MNKDLLAGHISVRAMSFYEFFFQGSGLSKITTTLQMTMLCGSEMVETS